MDSKIVYLKMAIPYCYLWGRISFDFVMADGCYDGWRMEDGGLMSFGEADFE